MKTNSARRDNWRIRFLEISRRYESAGEQAQPLTLSGLRPRARMAGFATLRRVRPIASS